MRRFVSIPVLVVGAAFLGVAARALADDTAPPPQSTARVSDLLSLAVYGESNEKLGKVEDIVVDPSSGKIRYAVLSFGGIFGIGDKYFAVPWHDLNVVHKGPTSAGTQKEEYATIDVSKDALKKCPASIRTGGRTSRTRPLAGTSRPSTVRIGRRPGSTATPLARTLPIDARGMGTSREGDFATRFVSGHDMRRL